MIPMPLPVVASAMRAVVEGDDPALTLARLTIDSRRVKPGDLFVAVRGERLDGHRFLEDAVGNGAVACVVDRAWAEGEHRKRCPVPCLVVSDTIEALGRLASYYRREVMSRCTAVVAITGSNGKTTTKFMIDHILSPTLRGRAAVKNYNNHIGVPLTLLSSEADDRYLVVEIGSNAPGEVATLGAMTAPDAVVISSIGEAHLEGLGGIEGVVAEKMSLLGHVRVGGLAVVNVDHPASRAHLARHEPADFVTVGTRVDAALRVTEVQGGLGGTSFVLDGCHRVELAMPGVHHATNAAAAFAVARWFGLEPGAIARRLGSFVPADGRCRAIEVGGVSVVDDAYNANPASLAAAIETLRAADGRRVLVMGDMLELGEASASLHARAVESVFESGIEILVAVGPLAAEAAQAMRHRSSTTRVHTCRDAEQAGDVLASLVVAGDRVWIKGSRSVGLERVVERLRAALCHMSAGESVVA